MRQLSATSPLPWCLIGDFNDMMTTEEKKGGVAQPRVLLSGFSEAIMDFGLLDLGFTGDMYTWERSRGTNRLIQERLDRGLATTAWIDMFPCAEVRVLEVSTSDHKPLFLNLHRQVYVQRQRRFRFENMWIGEAECKNIIQNYWTDDNGLQLMDKLVRCCAKLEEWGGGLVKDMKLKMADCQKSL